MDTEDGRMNIIHSKSITDNVLLSTFQRVAMNVKKESLVNKTTVARIMDHPKKHLIWNIL